MRAALVLMILVICDTAHGQVVDDLRQFQGLWSVSWTEGGNSKNAQAIFYIGGPEHLVALPFLNGLSRITHCAGMDCNGGNIIVSADGKDCVYTYCLLYTSPSPRD